MTIFIGLIILLFSAILHEVAHGYVAERLGDPTARFMGRLTLNPIPHIYPFMSIALPLLFILSCSPVFLIYYPFPLWMVRRFLPCFYLIVKRICTWLWVI